MRNIKMETQPMIEELLRNQVVVTEDEIRWELLINAYPELGIDNFIDKLNENTNDSKVLYDTEETDEFGDGYIRPILLDEVELSPNEYQEYAYIRSEGSNNV